MPEITHNDHPILQLGMDTARADSAPKTIDDALAALDSLERILGSAAVKSLQRQGKSDDQILAYFDPDTALEPCVCPLCGQPIAPQPLRPEGHFVVWNPLPACPNPACVQKRKDAEHKAQEEALRKEKERRFRAMVDMNLPKAGVPEKYAPCRLGRSRLDAGAQGLEPYRAQTNMQRQALRAAIEYRDNFQSHLQDGTGLYLCGPVGTGKTHLAAALANELMMAGHEGVLFITSMDLFRRIKAAFNDDTGLADRIVETCKYASLLIIDDLGKEYHSRSGWAMSVLAEILHAREERRRPCVFTSNFKPADLEARLAASGDESSAASVISRICGSTKCITLSGADYRRMPRAGEAAL